MSFDSAATLMTRLSAICLAQPLAAEKTSHGMAHFFIKKGRGFAWHLDDHHGRGIHAVALKTAGADEQDMLVERDPALFYRPPYLAPSGWIAYRLDRAASDWDDVEARVMASWAIAATPRERERFGR